MAWRHLGTILFHGTRLLILFLLLIRLGVPPKFFFFFVAAMRHLDWPIIRTPKKVKLCKLPQQNKSVKMLCPFFGPPILVMGELWANHWDKSVMQSGRQWERGHHWEHVGRQEFFKIMPPPTTHPPPSPKDKPSWMHVQASQWLHAESIPETSCHQFWLELIPLPKSVGTYSSLYTLNGECLPSSTSFSFSCGSSPHKKTENLEVI